MVSFFDQQDNTMSNVSSPGAVGKTVSHWSRHNPERILLGIRRYQGAIRACAKFLLLYPITNPKKANDFAHGVLSIQDDLSYADPVIPAVKPWEMFPGLGDVEVTLSRVLPREGSSVSPYELLVLCSIVKLLQPRKVFEIGTSLGVTAFNIALNLPEDGVIYTLDLPPVSGDTSELTLKYDVTISDRKMIFADRAQRRFLDSRVAPRVHQLYGDSALFDYSPYVHSCDLVFVDGSHARPYVEADTTTAFTLVKPGGVIVWHDYTDGHFWPEVGEYLREIGHNHTIRRLKGTSLAVTRVLQPRNQAK